MNSANDLKHDVEFKRGQFEALKAAYRLFGHGDLMKFFLFEEHRCIDKWVNYFPIYEQWFAPYRGKEIVFVEVGVQNGGSIQMWRNYFGKDAKIVGVDIDARCKQFEDADENIFVEIGSQDDENFWRTFKEKYPRVDILLDDGGHQYNQQITTFHEMFPHIKDGGLYMCEDCHTSYLTAYGGGMRKPNTFIEFMKAIIDEINSAYTLNAFKATYNTRNLRGLHFYDSIIVAEKSKLPFEPFALRIGKDAPIENFANEL